MGSKNTNQSIDTLIGRKIKEARKTANLSQEQLAERLGLTQQQISFYETGQNGIRANLLYEISNICRVPFVYFFIERDILEVLLIWQDLTSLNQLIATEQIKVIAKYQAS